MSKIGKNYRASVQKMIWGKSPTMEKLKRDRKVESGQCPLCGAADKEGHFLECKKIQQEKAVKVKIGNLKGKLRARGVNPIMSAWMLEVIQGRKLEKETLRPLGLHMRVSRLYDKQASIGWGNLLNGRSVVGII